MHALKHLGLVAALGWLSPAAFGFLGVGDTSFVTVIANPAEAANWTAQLERLANEVAAAQATLQTLEDLRAYAGEPGAATAALRDLAQITLASQTLSSGPGTGDDLRSSWNGLGSAGQLSIAGSLLGAAGPGLSMLVFGQSQARDLSLYRSLSERSNGAQQARSQIASEQSARALISQELALAWGRFRSATTETSKQAILAEITELESQDRVLDDHRRALMDDLDLAAKEGSTNAQVRSRADDEELLAESSELNAAASARARDSQSQRMGTLSKSVPAAPPQDYSGLRLWTTADDGAGSP